jgi:cell division protease FtsH
MNRFFKSAAFPILLVVVLAFFFTKLHTGSSGGRQHSYKTLVTEEIPKGEVKSVELKNKGKVLEVKLTNKATGHEETWEGGYSDQAAPQLISLIEKTPGIKFNIESEKSSELLSLLTFILPFVLFLGFWLFLMNQVQGGGNKVMSFGKSRAKRMSARDQGIPREPEEVPGARREDPDGCAAVWASRHRQDAAGACCRR